MQWVILIIILLVIFRPFKKLSNTPITSNQQALVNEVLAEIGQYAPDFDELRIGACVHCRSAIENPTKSGGIWAYKGRTVYLTYDFEEHGYSAGKKMWRILASEVVKHYGGEFYEHFRATSDHNEVDGYIVNSARYIVELRERQKNMRKC